LGRINGYDQIDWSIVATANSISNGHAARMRFHRLRQAMEGIAIRHRAAKNIDNSPDKAKGAEKHNTKTPMSRKAKELAMKRKLADISDDEEEPLAYVKARMRMKEELDGSEDEYVNIETEEKRIIRERIKREAEIGRDEEQGLFRPEKVKMENEESQSSISSGKKTDQVKLEDEQTHLMNLYQKETFTIKDDDVKDDISMAVDTSSPPTEGLQRKK
jgi:hypothetical protein